MYTRKILFPASLVVVLVCVAAAQKPEPPIAKSETEEKSSRKKDPLETFMQQKLGSSSKILEGLCLEDASLITAGANELNAMSKADLWNVLVDADYREYSREFHENTNRLAAAAQAGDFDKAALRWFDVTMSCLECHEHVRGNRRAEDSKKSNE